MPNNLERTEELMNKSYSRKSRKENGNWVKILLVILGTLLMGGFGFWVYKSFFSFPSGEFSPKQVPESEVVIKEEKKKAISEDSDKSTNVSNAKEKTSKENSKETEKKKTLKEEENPLATVNIDQPVLELKGTTTDGRFGDKITGFAVSASSTRDPLAGFTYGAKNLFDENSQTAWVEGVAGGGSGESLVFTYSDNKEKNLNEVVIRNGYAKTEKTFNENGCVTQMKMSVNGKLFANLSLNRTPQLQYFPVSNLILHSGDQLTFTLVDIQSGLDDSENDTALTDFFFYE